MKPKGFLKHIIRNHLVSCQQEHSSTTHHPSNPPLVEGLRHTRRPPSAAHAVCWTFHRTPHFAVLGSCVACRTFAVPRVPSCLHSAAPHVLLFASCLACQGFIVSGFGRTQIRYPASCRAQCQLRSSAKPAPPRTASCPSTSYFLPFEQYPLESGRRLGISKRTRDVRLPFDRSAHLELPSRRSAACVIPLFLPFEQYPLKSGNWRGIQLEMLQSAVEPRFS